MAEYFSFTGPPKQATVTTCYNRFMAEKLLLVPWFTGILYSSIPLFWFAIHPVAGRWQAMQRSPYRFLLPLWAIFIAALGAATWPWRFQQLYSTPWTWLIALPFFAVGLATYRRIGTEFGVINFIGQAELRPREHPQELVTGGLHSSMRHPIYAAHLSMLAGWTMGSGLTVNFWLLAASLCITFPLMIWMEERELARRFGPGYQSYRRSVPVFSLRAIFDHEQRAERREGHA